MKVHVLISVGGTLHGVFTRNRRALGCKEELARNGVETFLYEVTVNEEHDDGTQVEE